jgi:phosphatidate cytidylyltransferase
VGIFTILLLCTAAAMQHHVSVDLTGFALGCAILLTLASELPRHNHQHSLSSWTFTFAGACYIGWLLSYYILLRRIETPLHGGWLAPLHIAPGAAWVYVVLLITWSQDIAAYFVGRTWGKHRMAPILSPKKSWEGAVGGGLASIGVALLSVPLFGLPLGYAAAGLLGLMGAVAGPIGDLSESLIKRQIGIKDMGTILPGHGGILDRIDSMLFVGPTLYYLILLLTL